MLKDCKLGVPLTAKRRGTIKTYLADVLRLGKKVVEEHQLCLPLVRKVRMQTETCHDARRV